MFIHSSPVLHRVAILALSEVRPWDAKMPPLALLTTPAKRKFSTSAGEKQWGTLRKRWKTWRIIWSWVNNTIHISWHICTFNLLVFPNCRRWILKRRILAYFKVSRNNDLPGNWTLSFHSSSKFVICFYFLVMSNSKKVIFLCELTLFTIPPLEESGLSDLSVPSPRYKDKARLESKVPKPIVELPEYVFLLNFNVGAWICNEAVQWNNSTCREI